MNTFANVVIALVAALPVSRCPRCSCGQACGRALFGIHGIGGVSKVLAANQGLYNVFLAAGLGWGLLLGADGMPVKIFFLSCVLVAGLFGAATASRKILFVQALPAALGLALSLAAAHL